MARIKRLEKQNADPLYWSKVQKAWRERNPEKAKQVNQKQKFRKYGITEAIFWQMRAIQEDRCPICKKDLPPARRAHVDHDHNTGKVRSLLCRRCNTGLGYVENKDWIRAALAYLQHHGSLAILLM